MEKDDAGDGEGGDDEGKTRRPAPGEGEADIIQELVVERDEEDAAEGDDQMLLEACGAAEDARQHRPSRGPDERRDGDHYQRPEIARPFRLRRLAQPGREQLDAED